MSWNVEMVEILNKENEFEGEDWWAVTNVNKIENTFEVRNKEVAMDLCALLNCLSNKTDEQQAIIDKQELRLQQLEELLELSENLNKSYREKLIDMNLKMGIDDE